MERVSESRDSPCQETLSLTKNHVSSIHLGSRTRLGISIVHSRQARYHAFAPSIQLDLAFGLPATQYQSPDSCLLGTIPVCTAKRRHDCHCTTTWDYRVGYSS